MRNYFEYRHIVGLQETNVTGNVYFANHLLWQGRCREMFLRAHAPSIYDDLHNGLILLTIRCSCEYLGELFAMDEVALRMFLDEQYLNRLIMRFEYWRLNGEAEQLVAKGIQEIACMRRGIESPEPTSVPAALMKALDPFRLGLEVIPTSRVM
jgi:enediyne core biosynthesis thioesterase